MNYFKNIRNAALYSPFEIKIRDLTSNDPFAGNAQRARKEVAEATSNYENFLVTMRVIWERLNDTGKNWRHVYKGLQLLEYLMVYGAENVVLDAKNNLNRIKILRSFSYVDDHSFNDYGEGVRRLAERVLTTLASDEKLRTYRRQAEEGSFQGFPKLTEPSSFQQKKSGGAQQEERQPQRRRDDDYDDRPRRREEDYEERSYRNRRDDYEEQPRQYQQQQRGSRRDEEYDERPRPKQPQQQQQKSNLIGGLDFDNEDAYGDDDPYLKQYSEQQQQQQQQNILDFQQQSSAPLTDEEYYELEQLRQQLEQARHENEVLKRQLDKAKHQYDNLYRNTQH